MKKKHYLNLTVACICILNFCLMQGESFGMSQHAYREEMDHATLSSKVSVDDTGVEEFEDAVNIALPRDAVQIITTKKFMSEWDSLTLHEKKQAAKVIVKIYRTFLNNGRILGQLKNLPQYTKGKIGHCNFNRQLRQIYYLFNTEHNTIYFFFIGTKSSGAQSMYHGRTAINKRLRRVIMQCSGVLVSTHAMNLNGYQEIALTRLSDERLLGEVIRGLLINDDVEMVSDEDEDEKIDEQMHRLEQETRVIVEDYIEFFWEENDLRNNKLLLYDLVKVDVLVLLKEHYGKALLMTDDEVLEEVHAIVDEVYEVKCTEEDKEERERWIKSVRRTTFSDEVRPEIKAERSLEEKLHRIETGAGQVQALLEELEAWYEGYPEYTEAFHKELEKLFDAHSHFNVFLAAGDTRAWVKTRDELRFLHRQLNRAKEEAKSEFGSRIVHITAKVNRVTADIQTRDLPDTYREFKASLLQDCHARMESLDAVTSFGEGKEILETIDDLIADIADLNALEEAIEEIISQKGLLEGTPTSQFFDSDFLALYSVMEVFEKAEFETVYAECETFVQRLKGYVAVGQKGIE
ncbi:hypothetical protein N9934_04065 [Desulfosarcina sp.]|nr:hypothetical protein [Desulfosarcina sp.]